MPFTVEHRIEFFLLGLVYLDAERGGGEAFCESLWNSGEQKRNSTIYAPNKQALNLAQW
jgi:hypothetical protein